MHRLQKTQMVMLMTIGLVVVIASVKARVSNTTVEYGTQVLDIPVLAKQHWPYGSEYFTGVLATSHEIEKFRSHRR